jgi:hypothetical protein
MSKLAISSIQENIVNTRNKNTEIFIFLFSFPVLFQLRK